MGKVGVFPRSGFMHYLGIDVAKAKLDCSLLINQEQDKYKFKAVENSPAGFAKLLDWIATRGISVTELHIVMEATGIYHEQAALALHDAGGIVSIANPAHVKGFAYSLGVRTKTDGVDSRVLARYGLLTKPSRWQPPSAESRILKGLLARREAIKQDLQREKNRQEKAEAGKESAPIRQSITDSITFITAQLKKIQSQIDDHIDQDPTLKNDRELLESIPAIGSQSSTQLLAVMHTHTFNSAEQLTAYLGLVPIERQSGSSLNGRAKLSKSGPSHLRAILYMAAVVAVQHNPHVKLVYERLQAKGKTKMSALGAAMRKLVHLCFGVLKNQQKYQSDYKNA
jgi:transposase